MGNEKIITIETNTNIVINDGNTYSGIVSSISKNYWKDYSYR